MRQELARTIRDILSGAKTVHESADGLSVTAQQVATATESQSQSTAAAAAAVEELTVSIDHVGSNADEATQRRSDAQWCQWAVGC